jgi:thymidylate synthase (FAD)
MKTSDIEVKLIDFMGTDLSVVNAARVSFDKESEWGLEVVGSEMFEGEAVMHYGAVLKPGDVNLINYLAKHKHFSPFNHAFMTFRVKAPIFVARQLVKHKFLPWNEVSRRYVDSEPEFYIPKEYRAKADNVKQGSGEVLDESSFLEEDVEEHVDFCLNSYNYLLETGVCPEQARMVLPQNTMTEWIWSGTLGAFADMLRLRLDPHAQYESRIVAEKIKAEVEKLFPVSSKALLGAD